MREHGRAYDSCVVPKSRRMDDDTPSEIIIEPAEVFRSFLEQTGQRGDHTAAEADDGTVWNLRFQITNCVRDGATGPINDVTSGRLVSLPSLLQLDQSVCETHTCRLAL